MNDEVSESRNVVIDGLRWISLLPAAAISSYLAYLIMGWAGRFGLAFADMRADSIAVQVFNVTLVHACMGATFVYVGTSIAPKFRRVSSLVLNGLAIVITCLLAFIAIQAGDWWALTGAVSITVGAGVLGMSIWVGEIELLG